MEAFFKSYEATFAAITAISTFLAVVVSLAISIGSQRASRTQIKARVSVMVVLHSSLEGKPTPTYLSVEITNIGILAAVIPLSFFRWKVPFYPGAWILNPLDFSATDEWVQQKQYPVEIQPRHAKNFTLQSIDGFREMTRSNFIGKTFFERIRCRFLGAIILTDDGRIFKVSMDKSVYKELRTLRAKT
jgi:hypothetical protein